MSADTPSPVATPQPDLLHLEDAQRDWVHAAWDRIDVDHLAEVVQGMVDVPSPTGHERPLAAHLVDRLRAAGADATEQVLSDTQANALGRFRGAGGGRSLLLYAPIDTLTDGTEAGDLPWVGPELRDDMRPASRRIGDVVVGLGASNPKGHGATALVAAAAIAAAEVPLQGDLLVGFGAGGMPTNDRTAGSAGRRSVGHGVGCSFLLEQGGWADEAVVVKPGWAVAWEEVGLSWFELEVHGTHGYVGSRHRIPYRNAIVDAGVVAAEFETWLVGYTARHTDGLVAPQGQIGACEAGWMAMPALSPAVCRLRVDLRTNPRSSPPEIAREMAGFVARVHERHPDIRVDVRPLVVIPGSGTSEDAAVVRSTIAAWEAVAGEAHVPLRETSGATDANILRNRGVPTARVGMSKLADGRGVEVDFAMGMNAVDLREMERLARLLVVVAVDRCSRSADAVAS